MPGSAAGFIADCDAAGNRFNPNKLLLDPYTRESSHDPLTPAANDPSVYMSGNMNRNTDSASVAPKAIVLNAGRRRRRGNFKSLQQQNRPTRQTSPSHFTVSARS